MAPRRHPIGLVPVLFGLLPLLIASCVVEATGPRSPVVVTGDGAITVASFDFPESALLAEIYAQAMEAKGFTVQRALNVGPRELVEPALERGLVEFVPEYVGTAVEFLRRGSGHATADLDSTRKKAIEAFAGRGVDVLASAPAQDSNALAVTAQTAARFSLRTISDLARVA